MIRQHPELACKLLRICVFFLPKRKIKETNAKSCLFSVYMRKINKIRYVINNLKKKKRDYLVRKYLIDTVNTLFDKNYVNCAQYTLLSLEEWILSWETDKEFEDALALFKQHAIDAGLRFREKFPLPEVPKSEKTKIAFTSYWTSNMGTEGIMALSARLQQFDKKFIALKTFSSKDLPAYEVICEENDIELILPKEKVDYDVFAYRKLFLENPVEICFWIHPPMHMFFFFAFGLAPKQVWFSLYLRSNLEFPYLDGKLTPGGCGFSHKKHFNGSDWAILPQITYINNLTPKVKKKVTLFVPGRLEKLKQQGFLEALLKIMKAAPETVLKWTGYYQDQEIIQILQKHGFDNRQFYTVWQDMKGLYKEIKTSDIILSPFPLALGTTEMMASVFNRPIISMYNEECSMYWRDCYWEAEQGDPVLRKICMDENGRSILRINKTPEDYIEDTLNVIADKELAKKYAQVYHDAYEYTYINNPNDVEKIFSAFISDIIKGDKNV